MHERSDGATLVEVRALLYIWVAYPWARWEGSLTCSKLVWLQRVYLFVNSTYLDPLSGIVRPWV